MIRSTPAIGTLRSSVLPPLLEIYVVWHPGDRGGADVAERLIDHFHGTAFSGLIGGAVEVFVRSEGWESDQDAPRSLPCVDALPYDLPEAELTVVIPILGVELARAVEDGEAWSEYMDSLLTGAEPRSEEVCVLPVKLETAVSEGTLHESFSGIQTIHVDNGLCREIAQGIAQFARPEQSRLKVFLSHTKRGGPVDDPNALVHRVRELILDTKLADFFDAQDLQPGADWSAKLLAEAAGSAMLAIRTDQYASREWCQKEVVVAKRAGMPIVILDALSLGEKRGSFLMDNTPRIPLHDEVSDNAIMRALDQLVDECLKRTLWIRQKELASRTNSNVASWWAPHAPEPVTFTSWLEEARADLADKDTVVVLHPDPPLGPDEIKALKELGKLCGLADRLEVLTPRGLAIRGD
jgi:hypothetical protein